MANSPIFQKKNLNNPKAMNKMDAPPHEFFANNISSKPSGWLIQIYVLLGFTQSVVN